MTNEFHREDRYLVLKRTDIERMSAPQQASLFFHADEVARMREVAGKPPLACVVVESDWPEYEAVWKMIEARCSGESSAEPVAWCAIDEGGAHLQWDRDGGHDWIPLYALPPDDAAEVAKLRAEVERLTKEYADQADACRERTHTIAQQAERIAELERQSQALARSVMTDQTYDETRNMFHAAILDLAAISEALDCDPDDGGAVPIIEAIDELKARIAAQSAALSKARDALCDATQWNWLDDDMPQEVERRISLAIGKIDAIAQLDGAQSGAPAECWCEKCRPQTLGDMRMVVCPTCGNKRCPHATDHRNACTGSNDPGQPGSAYAAQAGEPTQITDAQRWNAIELLMTLGNVDLTQEDDGGYGINFEPAENFVGQIWTGGTPEQVVDKVVDWACEEGKEPLHD